MLCDMIQQRVSMRSGHGMETSAKPHLLSVLKIKDLLVHITY